MQPSHSSSDWKSLYEVAIRETDRKKLPERIAIAKNAILNRIEQSMKPGAGRSLRHGRRTPQSSPNRPRLIEFPLLIPHFKFALTPKSWRVQFWAHASHAQGICNASTFYLPSTRNSRQHRRSAITARSDLAQHHQVKRQHQHLLAQQRQDHSGTERGVESQHRKSGRFDRPA